MVRFEHLRLTIAGMPLQNRVDMTHFLKEWCDTDFEVS